MSQRKTGRTTRMIDAAISVARKNRHVVIVAATDDDRGRITACVAKKGLFEKVKVIDPTLLSDCEWLRICENPEFRGATTFFIDHYAIEQHFSSILMRLHEFDLPEEQTP